MISFLEAMHCLGEKYLDWETSNMSAYCQWYLVFQEWTSMATHQGCCIWREYTAFQLALTNYQDNTGNVSFESSYFTIIMIIESLCVSIYLLITIIIFTILVYTSPSMNDNKSYPPLWIQNDDLFSLCPSAANNMELAFVMIYGAVRVDDTKVQVLRKPAVLCKSDL